MILFVRNIRSVICSGKIIILCSILFGCSLLAGCGQPVLESSECIEARDQVKKFYSFHIGNDMTPSEANFNKRKAYLSDQLASKLIEQNLSGTRDYFTQTDDYPKAFRAGKCKTVGQNRADFEVVLFWRNNEKSIERKISVEAIKENDSWLIDSVTSEN